MDRPVPQVPLQLTALAILAPNNAPLYVRSFTGKQDELRHYHLAHAAVDVIEERIVMTSTPTKPADSYLGLLFCMEDMAFYGFQTAAKIRMVLSVALVDATIKDADVVAAKAAPPVQPEVAEPTTEGEPPIQTQNQSAVKQHTPGAYSSGRMFATGPEDLKVEWLAGSEKFEKGISRLGQLLDGGR